MSFIATLKFEHVSYSRVRTKMALSYLLGLWLWASCFLLFALHRSANITIKMMISRPPSPPIKADNCVPESPLPPSDSGDLSKHVSLAVFLWCDPDPDQWSKICLDHGAWKEPANPLRTWIHRFLWCTRIQTDLGSLIRSDPDHPKGTQLLFVSEAVNMITADFSAVYRPGCLKHDLPVHDSPVVIRP